MMFRFMTTGRGMMCMGGHQASGTTEVAEMRRELQALRDELKEVKAAR